jgi:hypothetical protein
MKRTKLNCPLVVTALLLFLVTACEETEPATEPEVSTSPLSEITASGVKSGGTVLSDGGEIITANGVCWSTNPNPTISDSKTTDATGSASFTSNITGLSAGTTYHVRAYATNSVGTAYGDNLSFTTLGEAPACTTMPATNVSDTEATLNGSINANELPTTVTFEYGTDPDFSNGGEIEATQSPVSGNSSIEVSVNLTGLSMDSTYYYRVKAVNSLGETYGEGVSFRMKSYPYIQTASISSVQYYSAVGGGDVTYDGGLTVSARGVCWNTSGDPTISDNITSDGDGTGSYTSDITGLTPNTTYYVKAYATNSLGTAYGYMEEFTTPAIPPTVTTGAITNRTSSSATAGGEVTDSGSNPVTDRGVCYATNSNPDFYNSRVTSGSGSGQFSVNITGLDPSTIYYARAYAATVADTSYGENIMFETLAPNLPQVTTKPAEWEYYFNFILTGGEVISDGGGTVTERGVCWSTNPEPTIDDYHTMDGGGTGEYYSSISTDRFSPGTDYYARAFARNSAGVAYGSTVTFNTQWCIPFLHLGIAELRGTEIRLSVHTGNFERGEFFLYNLNTSESEWIDFVQEGFYGYEDEFFQTISGLIPGNDYYIQAMIQGWCGSPTETINFTTPDLPGLTTEPASDITSSSAVSGGNIFSDGGSYVFDRGICWSTHENPTINDNYINAGYGTGSFTATMNGLEAGQTYYVRSYAINEDAGIAYGQNESFTTDNK